MRLNSGTLLILVMLGLGVASSAFSLWFHYRASHRALDFWSHETALVIARAPQVTALQLAPSDDGAPDGPVAADAAAQRREVMAAKGFSNVRRALVEDLTFDWQSPEPVARPAWRYALEFVDGPRTVTLRFDFDNRRIGELRAGKTLLLEPSAAADFRVFFAEQFAGLRPMR